MRRRALALVTAVVAAGALALGTATEAGASVRGAKAPVCAGKTKKKAIKAIKKAYDHFLNGAKYPDAVKDKEPYIELLSGGDVNAALKADFEASSAKNAAAAATTNVDVDKVTCAGKKKADVIFTLVIGGSRAEGLAPPGAAVLDGKTWKVTADTLCNLQGLGDATILEREPCASVVAGG